MARPEAHRKFYDFTKTEENEEEKKGDEEYDGGKCIEDSASTSPEDLVKYVSENIIGGNKVFSSPFGPRKVVYSDYIASGRSLQFIEDYINNEVLPLYGSTHTTSTVTALQTTLFRHEARDIIRNATQASEHDRVMFVGNGATGAMQKLIHGLNLSTPSVVLVDPYAHHSSLLPWREMGAKVIRIRETAEGSVDISHVEQTLKEESGKQCQIIGCFTAASNVTGIIADDIKLTTLLHRYGALAFWDYATAAPYVLLTMNPMASKDFPGDAAKDAMFFSMHKFLGGVQTPGILIAKRRLFENPSPEVCGGGTVFFVSRESHRYLKDIETREEGGTPAIVEAIRAGLVMQLKNNITSDFILARNTELNKKLRDFVHQTPGLLPLGNLATEERIPILSFVVHHNESGLLIHHNFICAILNDLFGVQARGGCACAGPYAQDLLGIDEDLAQRYEQLLVEDARLDRSHLRRQHENSEVEVLRPGFVRLNLPYSASDDQIEFILQAVREVCINGWRLLPQYSFNPETGEWKHHTNLVFRERQWLQNISYAQGRFTYCKRDNCGNAPDYEQCIKSAQDLFEQSLKAAQRRHVPDDTLLFGQKAADLRWFLLPSEAKQCLLQSQAGHEPFTNCNRSPFIPPTYPLTPSQLLARPDFIWQTLETQTVSLMKKDIVSQRTCKDAKQREKPAVPELTTEILNGTSTNVPHEKADLAKDESTKEGSQSFDAKQKKSVLCTKETEKGDRETGSQNSGRKGKIVCEDLKCFVKRDDSVGVTYKGTLKWYSPPKNIFNPTVEVLQEFNMIHDGDRVLVCLSGGKDSLSLLHTLHQYQFYARASSGTTFTLGAVTVDPMSASYDPRPLIPYLASLGVPYFFEQQDILKQAADLETLNSICSFCSRMKRGRIYAAARREGYNVLAFGQHLDDLAESFMMSVFHNGRIRTMKAHYTVKEGDLRVIRPFVHVREKYLREFAERKKLPVIPENCPACFEAPKERHRVKQMLAQQEILFPGLYWSLRTALRPVMSITITRAENAMFGKNGILSPSRIMDLRDQILEEEEEEEEG